ncbi:hypothetical protein GFS24_05475 [Chitinophaga sp. SYP-B3965]|uniref:hypothetical protein n=1 Tax=Chitinophaga sp. SYP-B3965 TaxID=2663120 RepID=UPI001299D78A|nr:hypothetical protein [Chitinophaga sp. SYP-B3965]MRG44552.1 hypothetical protein [Chitinophaga sp. SYP-B3965]
MKYFYLLACLIVLACGPGKTNSKEKEQLDLYLSEIYKVDLKEYPKSIAIIVSGNCGSCTEKTIRFIKKIDQDKRFDPYKKLLVIPVNNASVKDSIGNGSSFRIIIDEHQNIDKYGINLPKNLFLECEKGDVVFQDWLYLEKIDTIAAKYGVAL